MTEKRITVQQILNDLDNGLTRQEIKAKYSLVGREMTALFNHPKLKNKKARKKVDLVIVDEDELQQASAPQEEMLQEKETIAEATEEATEELPKEEKKEENIEDSPFV